MNNMKYQNGFSAASLFFMGLAIILVMNMTGFFDHYKSEITDQTQYTPLDAEKFNSGGLHMEDMKFATPTPTVTPIPPTTVPITIEPTEPAPPPQPEPIYQPPVQAPGPAQPPPVQQPVEPPPPVQQPPHLQ